MIKILFISVLSLSLWGMSSYSVSEKSDAATSGFKDASSDMYMTLINAKGQKRERHMKIIMLEKEGGDKSLMTFISPADIKGTKFLNYEHIKKDDDQWLYIPALKKVKRIASKNKSGSFMGSEFSYEDLSSFNVNKYTYKGEATIVSLDGKKLYKGERFPITENSGYTKNVFWIDTTTFLLHKVDYYDRKHALIKTAHFSGYKKISGSWRTGKIIMQNHQNDKKTILLWKDEKVNIGLKEKSFHKRVLKKR